MPTLRITALGKHGCDGPCECETKSPVSQEYDVDLSAEQWQEYSRARAEGRLHVLAENGFYVIAEEARVDPNEEKDKNWSVVEKGHVIVQGRLAQAAGKVDNYHGKRLSGDGAVETL